MKETSLFFSIESALGSNANGSIMRSGGDAAAGAYARNLFVRALKFHKSCT